MKNEYVCVSEWGSVELRERESEHLIQHFVNNDSRDSYISRYQQNIAAFS